MFQVIAKLPDHSILSCTLTAKYYKYFDVIEPNNDSRMYICNVNVKTENNLFHDINHVKFNFQIESE